MEDYMYSCVSAFVSLDLWKVVCVCVCPWMWMEDAMCVYVCLSVLRGIEDDAVVAMATVWVKWVGTEGRTVTVHLGVSATPLFCLDH